MSIIFTSFSSGVKGALFYTRDRAQTGQENGFDFVISKETQEQWMKEVAADILFRVNHCIPCLVFGFCLFVGMRLVSIVSLIHVVFRVKVNFRVSVSGGLD